METTVSSYLSSLSRKAGVISGHVHINDPQKNLHRGRYVSDGRSRHPSRSSRFELTRGEIIEMPLPGSPHAGRVKRLNHLSHRGLLKSPSSVFKIPFSSTAIRRLFPIWRG